ncbi:MAG: hypothetical protein ACFFAN_08820 [Promethearchaeota archaeon]
MYSESLSLTQQTILTIDDFLSFYKNILNLDAQEILNLDFKSHKECDFQKLSLTLQLAEPKDALKITSLFNEVYRGTYPYKKMEDVSKIREMITDPNHIWFLFKIHPNDIAGCFGADLNLDKKRTYMYGFVLKPKYQKFVDIIKIFIGTWIYLCKNYKKKVLIYHGEARTNDTASQYVTSICGMKPIAFFPNKDIFFNRIESNFMIIAYYNEILKELNKENPRIIRQVLNSYFYSNKRYNLGIPVIENPDIKFELKEVKILKRKIVEEIEVDIFGYELIKYSIKNSDSYFQFFYNPYSKCIEKTKYNIEKLDELYAFLQVLKNLIQKKDINYFECFVSAYDPSHQKIFYNTGFMPRGYVPSWEYNKKENVFEDRVIFNYYRGEIDKNIKLIPETRELLEILNVFNEELIVEDNELIQTREILTS